MLKFKWETEFKETKIGKIPTEWKVKKMSEVVEIEQGKNFPILKLRDNGYPVFGANGIIGYCEEYHYEEPQVLIACRGSTCGIINKSLPYSFVNNNAMALLPKNEIDKRFLFFYMNLSYKKGSIDSAITGTGQPQITKQSLSPFTILIPPLPEQSRIATVLSWFDDLIENKKRQNEILEKTAMAIFKRWFIDFEPFKDEEFVDSELGEIPKAWEVKAIGEIAEFRNGLSYKGSEKFSEPVEDNYIFVNLNNIKEGRGFKPEYAWIKSNRLKERHFLKEGDLIFANTEQTKSGRLLATPALVIFPPHYDKEIGVYSCDTTLIIPKFNLYKLYLYLKIKLNQEDIAQSYHTGTGVWHFALKNFKETYRLLLPPNLILQKFHSVIEPLFQKIILNQKQIMVLRKIRDTLLPLLVFGKLRMEEI